MLEMEGNTQRLEKRLGEAMSKLATTPSVNLISQVDRVKDSEILLEGILSKMEIACRSVCLLSFNL